MFKKRFHFTLVVASLIAMLVAVPFVSAATGTDTSALRAAVTLEGVRAHQAELQEIADANNGTRVAGTAGYDESAEYVYNLLDGAGYDVSRQFFDFAFFQELSPPVLERVSPDPVAYTDDDFSTMDYSGSGDVTASLQAVDLLLPPTGGSTSGCEADDFASFTAGNIALIQRGTCTFAQKAVNAETAGATGVIIFNEGNAPDRIGLLFGTLGTPVVSIPVVGTTFALGEQLAGLLDTGEVVMHMVTDTVSEIRTTYNVIANTPTGRTDRVVLVGAHLDSVPEGPGINDNGSGSAVILETALQMAALGIQPKNQVRFAFWSAEESNLVGSTYYVSQLSKRDIKNIAVNLNFDMVGSPNFVRFVYDGDGSGTPLAGPNGSAVVEDVFLDYFASQNLPTEPTAFDGRSDYGPFIAVGIPAGGLFTGAEGIKTAEQAAIYGGTAGAAFDPCYHQACDTYANNSDTALHQMADATAHAVLSFAMTTSAVNGTDKGKAWGQSQELLYWGNELRK